jgi:hypothetical protein
MNPHVARHVEADLRWGVDFGAQADAWHVIRSGKRGGDHHSRTSAPAADRCGSPPPKTGWSSGGDREVVGCQHRLHDPFLEDADLADTRGMVISRSAHQDRSRCATSDAGTKRGWRPATGAARWTAALRLSCSGPKTGAVNPATVHRGWRLRGSARRRRWPRAGSVAPSRGRRQRGPQPRRRPPCPDGNVWFTDHDHIGRITSLHDSWGGSHRRPRCTGGRADTTVMGPLVRLLGLDPLSRTRLLARTHSSVRGFVVCRTEVAERRMASALWAEAGGEPPLAFTGLEVGAEERLLTSVSRR